MKVVLFWGAVSGYMAACWRELSRRPDIDLLVVTHAKQSDSAFDAGVTSGINHRTLDLTAPDAANTIKQIVRDHDAQVVNVPGWAHRAFFEVARDESLRGVRFMMSMDTPLLRTWRQRLARFKLWSYLSRMDRVMVAGERAFQLARYLNVPEHKIRRGVYGLDAAALEPAHAQRLRDFPQWPKRFLFIGRYVPEKGVDVLLDAYARYRKNAADPWPLTCCGMGPLKAQVASQEGVEDAGFVQPAELAQVMGRSGAFVLSSRYEPWGVVLAEACMAGLPVICTEACGGSVELVRPHYNGLTVATADAGALASALHWTEAHHAQLATMGERSRQFGAAFAADVWADRWQCVFAEIMDNRARS